MLDMLAIMDIHTSPKQAELFLRPLMRHAEGLITRRISNSSLQKAAGRLQHAHAQPSCTSSPLTGTGCSTRASKAHCVQTMQHAVRSALHHGRVPVPGCLIGGG